MKIHEMLSTNTCSLWLKIFVLSSVLNSKYKEFRIQFLIKIRHIFSVLRNIVINTPINLNNKITTLQKNNY